MEPLIFFIMKIFKTIKNKIKSLAAKIAGVAPQPSFANIYIIKNNLEIYKIQSTSSDISNGVCKILSYFSKYNNYKIIYNYPEKDIYIYFTVKKADELEPDNSNNKK